MNRYTFTPRHFPVLSPPIVGAIPSLTPPTRSNALQVESHQSQQSHYVQSAPHAAEPLQRNVCADGPPAAVVPGQPASRQGTSKRSRAEMTDAVADASNAAPVWLATSASKRPLGGE